MASAIHDQKAGKARVFFRYGGRQFNRVVKVKSQRAAEALCETIEQTIADLDRGRLTLPPDADLVTFLISGGSLAASPAEAKAAKPLTLDDIFERYRADPPPHLESSTRRMQEMHFRHLLRVFPTKQVKGIDRSAAQDYISRRTKQSFRNRPIQRETIAKELKSLRQAWNWVASQSKDLPQPSFTLKELSFPKGRERPPFMSWSQIEQEVARGGLNDNEVAELWDSLWLDRGQVAEFLEHFRQSTSPPFLHPMVCFAAYTGARRSELCRSQIADWRFENATVKIRQKKRDKDKSFTYRDVAIHPKLSEVMKDWFVAHPGGRFAFCKSDREELTWSAATYHFKESLSGSVWGVVRGWHVLRHSFASNLASVGVDQRKIDRWMGHSTDVRWRYQHLRPEDERNDIATL
jgi:integrase